MNIVSQICGLVILLVLYYFYRSQKKLKLNTRCAFMGIWSITFLVLIFDIFSVVSIYFIDSLSMSTVKLVCKIYLMLIVWQALFSLRYILMDMLNKNIRGTYWDIFMHIYGIVSDILIFVFPISIAKQKQYTYGSSVIITYYLTIATLVFVVYLLIKNREKINPRRRNGVVCWYGIWLLASAIQYMDKSLLITSVASVIGILIIFLKLEDPEINLDRETGLFNLNAFFQYIKQLQGEKQNVSLLLVSYDSNRNGSMDYEEEKVVVRQIIEFVESIESLEGAIAFRSSSNEVLFLAESEDEAYKILKRVKDRFDEPWGNDYFRMLSVEWYLVESTMNIERANDVLPIFQYARQNKGVLAEDGGVCIKPDNIAQMYEERDIENVIVEALKDNRIEVFYQPIYSVKDKKFNCAEALVRIRDKDGQIIPPAQFIGVAEKRGLIIRIGEAVFNQVCQFLVKEQPSQYGLEYIEVNLSVLQCGYEHLADDFIAIMKRHKVDPSSIVLEITESASISEKEILLSNMHKLRQVGVRFALDDFGTGQSNLNYIVEMPVDVVKFDSTMINAYFENNTAKHVMDAAMQMIQGMDLEIVSEGIEEKKQYKTMKELGIDYIQGYYFSKPVESDEFVNFIREKSK